MSGFLRSRQLSFKYAYEGLRHVLRTQPNSWIHLIAAALVGILAIWLQLPLRDLAVLILVIGLVWVTECVNTSIEAVVDQLSPQRHPAAKIAKDVGAAAVLISALIAVIVGLLILSPPLLRQLF